MYRAQKQANRITSERDVRHRQRLHAQKLKNMTSSVVSYDWFELIAALYMRCSPAAAAPLPVLAQDTKAPRTTKMRHLRQRLKKEQLEEGRSARFPRATLAYLHALSPLQTGQWKLSGRMGSCWGKLHP